jgi:hypothetical protein
LDAKTCDRKIINRHNVEQDHFNQNIDYLENCDVLRYAQDFPINNKNDIADLFAGIVTIVNLATYLFIPKVNNQIINVIHKPILEYYAIIITQRYEIKAQ